MMQNEIEVLNWQAMEAWIYLPSDMMQNDMSVPMAPKSIIVMKLRKNCFFLTWNLRRMDKE